LTTQAPPLRQSRDTFGGATLIRNNFQCDLYLKKCRGNYLVIPCVIFNLTALFNNPRMFVPVVNEHEGQFCTVCYGEHVWKMRVLQTLPLLYGKLKVTGKGTGTMFKTIQDK
jgi:hypothetical protein